MGREDDLEEGKETAALIAAAMVDQKKKKKMMMAIDSKLSFLPFLFSFTVGG